jgi:MFS family permease
VVLLRWLPPSLSWRVVFLSGAALGLCIVLVRRHLPESPRWLLLHGRIAEAAATVARIETAVHRGAVTADAATVATEVEMTVLGNVGFAHVAHILLRYHLRRTILGLALMLSQSVFYNAIFFSYALILVRFYAVPADRTGLYVIPFALGNFLGPLLLGRWFDTIGRRRMISITYVASGLGLLSTGGLFAADLLTATTQTLCWCAVFFVASAAASSAYLTVSELFPVQIRGIAIALFFVVSQSAGAIATAGFGWMIDAASRPSMFLGYGLSAVLMIGAGVIAARLAVDAEGQSLEQLAERQNPPKM